jgi:putative PA domain protein
MTKFKKAAIKTLSFVGAVSFISGVFSSSFKDVLADDVSNAGEKTASVSKLTGDIKTNQEDFYDKNAIFKLPEDISPSEEVSIIVTMSTDSIMDSYRKSGSSQTLSEYTSSAEASKVSSNVADEQAELVKILNKSRVNYTLGETYDTILSGFEITIQAKDFEKVGKLLDSKANLIVGETYAPAETEVVTNEVDVYETGIFDSSESEYQGDGVVVAILDTGLDYTHSAFSVDNFTTTNEAFTLDNVSEKVNDTLAADFTPGLTGEDVYVNKKVPYAYDYADKDPDVLPIDSEHGTHVAGIIAGKDDRITGVAPNAQLAIMKVFSDTQTGAKTSWILAALEDCVNLGVDVINMSLGTAAGFTREVDEEKVSEIYDSIREAGISLIVAAGNDYNATFGSEKNGSNALTSNPDSGVVGSPSTYEGALSVASVDGVKTPYLLYNDEIIYFHEASTSSAKTKDFVDDILKTVGDGVTSHDFEYVTIPGVGRPSDYIESKEFYKGKIVLVKRGTTNFEDKVRVALQQIGAAGIIIYNNVSGTISMSVGSNTGAVCSISQEEGEMLAAAGSGVLRVSKEQVAGPFMSDFSSWGPTSDLRIKPEITAHGGEILSAVPGQDYDRLSGTSMAAPNQAGATALIRQYVKYSGTFGELSNTEITARVNQLMMSTADIVYNKNGLPYAVRKQGAGLVNINKAATSAAYLTTYDKNGETMDKTKFELGDDKERTGVYEMTFDIHNISQSSVSYNVDAIVMSEGVSEIYTSHSDRTVTQDGYLLSGAKTTVTAVQNGQQSGNSVTVAAGSSATVTVKIVLSEEDKKYIADSFEYGMYVEGFITLEATSGTDVDLNIPMLAFFGDWEEAPVFDEEYYDTNVDEIDSGKDPEDKLMADAYATRVIGGLYSDYIATLGSYYFVQDPSATQIAANKEHIAISNQTGESGSINNIYGIWAGLLRNAKEVNISIVEDSTGREIFNKTSYNQRKSWSSGNTIYQSSIDVDFSALEHNLKNNTKYNVKVTTYIDYGDKESQDQANVRNTFEFPLYIDFEAPVVTDVVYRTEYDRTTKKTKLFADLNIYDNHYAMSVQIGQVTPADPSSGYTLSMSSFGKYMTPVYSSFNSTSTVTIELTDYIEQIRNSVGYDKNGNLVNNNSFVATCYDYAMNFATYEITLPDEFLSMAFAEDEIRLSPNETKLIDSEVLKFYPETSWLQVLDFESSDPDIADVVNQTIIAKKSGTATITAIGYDEDGNKVTADVNVKVLAEGEEGYNGGYSVPEVSKFTLTGYKTNKAYYSTSSDEREIGLTGGNYDFDGDYSLSMFPSESVTLEYSLDSYFPERTEVIYKSGNDRIATVSEDGTIVAQAEGTTIISVNVLFDGKPTFYSGNVTITVKDPFTTNSIYLMSYKGLGGEVTIPDDRGVTTIYAYAFSGYEYVDKDLSAGDVINDEDPYYLKQQYIGDDTITKIVIPEGVEEIQQYAFANLTALEEVVLPTSLKKIGVGAFFGCNKLKKINLENAKFINEKAFSGCALEEIDLSSVVAIGNYTFESCKLNYVELPASSQSLGVGAFYKNDYLTSVEFRAPKIKIGSYAFAECAQLGSVDINAAVISSYAFQGCTSLGDVTLGKDVAVIGEYAFAGTAVSAFELAAGNTALTAGENGALLYKNTEEGKELVLAAPEYAWPNNTVTTDATSIATGAFAGNTKIYYVNADNVTKVGSYAFADCSNLRQVSMKNVETIGDYAFAATAITATPDLSNVSSVGDYAFVSTKITSVTVADNTEIGNYAFALCGALESVTIGNNVTVGEYAFYCPVYILNVEATSSNKYYTPYTYEVKNEKGEVVQTFDYYRYNFNAGVTSKLTKVTIGDGVTLGNHAFDGNAKLTSLTFGSDAKIGDFAFFNAAALKNVDLSRAKSIGANAFSGSVEPDIEIIQMSTGNVARPAYKWEYKEGGLVASDYFTTQFAPAFTKADLTNATSVGEYAFANNEALTTVVIGSGLTEIADYVFANCIALSSAELPEQIGKVGNYAFFKTALTEVELGSVSSIGEYAFAQTDLTKAVLKAGVTIGDGAFAYCYDLATVENLSAVNTIGASAFAGTALTEAILTDVTYIGDFAFGDSKITKVELGEKLVSLGENPFYGCNIESFGKYTEAEFNGESIGKQFVETYDVSSTVKVIDGVLYQSVPNGLELVSYPMAKTGASFVVEEGTVRISARAFFGSALQNVTLPSTLKALGDKAFYANENLAVVVFKSYNAPILEEEYDESYAADTSNVPFVGFTGLEGLGITEFYIWNITGYPSNFYFGANFVDYIGHISDNIVMVKPANGQNYDSFILSQYFGTSVDGSNAATEETLKVIDMINALPADITLDNKEAVEAALAAYNSLIPAQQALVGNYETLKKAKATIDYLESLIIPPTPTDPEDEKQPSAFVKFMKNNWIGLTIAAVAVVALAVYITINEVNKKKATKRGTEDSTNEESVNEEENKKED